MYAKRGMQGTVGMSLSNNNKKRVSVIMIFRKQIGWNAFPSDYQLLYGALGKTAGREQNALTSTCTSTLRPIMLRVTGGLVLNINVPYL